MRTYSFIGSDKNAGKTTAFNHVYREMRQVLPSRPICLSSIGINGEEVDCYEGKKKPHIDILPGSYFITHSRHLAQHGGKYETLLHLRGPSFSGSYIFARSVLEMQLVLEGPNTGKEIRLAKHAISPLLDDETVLLLDGSIDRQFLAQPEISDGFYFAVSFSRREQQLRKAMAFLRMISLPQCSEQTRATIQSTGSSRAKAMLFSESGVLLYRGDTIAFQDQELREHCDTISGTGGALYLNGAMTRSLYDFLAPFSGLQVILDNFTLYLNIVATPSMTRPFRPTLCLYHPVSIQTIFIKQETVINPSLLPAGVLHRNLFRELHHEG